MVNSSNGESIFRNVLKIKYLLWSHQESNLDLKFRKLPFYPLNYGTKEKGWQKYGDLAKFSNTEVRLLLLCLGTGAARAFQACRLIR